MSMSISSQSSINSLSPAQVGGRNDHDGDDKAPQAAAKPVQVAAMTGATNPVGKNSWKA